MSPLRLIILALAAIFVTGTVMAQQAGLRSSPELNGPDPAMEVDPAGPIPRWVADDVRLMRQYPEQPPIIPHSIEGYQLTNNANRCNDTINCDGFNALFGFNVRCDVIFAFIEFRYFGAG